MRISIIVVMDEKTGGIGFQGAIPWMGKVPSDMKRFKELTTGHPVIMGRKTYASMGHALPNRTNIVLSSDRNLTLPDAIVIHSLEHALVLSQTAEGNDEVFIIGGAEVYGHALQYAERMYLTLVGAPFTCDTYFPAYRKEEWTTVADELIAPDEKNLFPLHFVMLQKKIP
ncbi:MAG: dihydrofolate reductase [bacterium]|nr:dihydrofolate reductase [bacterium]